MKKLTFATAAALVALHSGAYAQDTGGADQGSPIDTVIPADKPAEAAPTKTGDPVLDRLNALESRVHQLEARNAELEAQAAQTESRVQNVEVRSAKAAQPGVVPVFADVNDTFTFKPRGMLQLDYAAYSESKGGYGFANGTDIRRGRFGFEGTAFKRFKWRLDAEYVKQQVNLLDAYINYAINPKFSVQVGQHKAPYGLEANTSDAINTFMERSFASNAFGAVAAERRVGLSLFYNTDKLNVQVGIFGAGEGVSRNSDTAAAVSTTTAPCGNPVGSAQCATVSAAKFGTHDEPWSVNGRVTWDPIFDTGRIVHVGVSGYHVTNLAGNTVTISDRPNIRVDGGNLFSVAIPGTVTTTGQTGVKAGNYIGAEAAIVYGPFSVQSEYGALALDRYGTASTLNFSGFNVFGTFFITGESRSFKGGNVDKVKPFKDFDPAKGNWGAFEIAARYDQIYLDDPTLPVPTSPTSSNLGGRKAHSYTTGVNWYLNPNFRAVFNYVHFFGRYSPLVAPTAAAIAQVGTTKGDIFATRLQLDF
jgi:phosphate-selective porin OprO/OprP